MQIRKYFLLLFTKYLNFLYIIKKTYLMDICMREMQIFVEKLTQITQTSLYYF